ncbi:imidazolonepropionase [Chloroflexota bacterium]|nr:imidazolonepropionase [Chloroflexota bacterium]
MTPSNLTLIHNASQLLTLAGGPQRGHRLGELSLIQDGAIVIDGSRIVATGRSAALLERYSEADTFDAQRKVVMPGFVDPHTHMVWAGDRAGEFEMRLQGKTYMEIMAAGGGIVSTVNATREASVEALAEQTGERLSQAFRYGTTTVEVKTGYGLELASELKQLEVILALNTRGPISLVPTFLGAHAIPTEYADRPDEYVTLLCEGMLPEVKKWWQEHTKGQPLPFVDVFCEDGAFDLTQSRRILETAKELGYPLKIHADEFKNLGGASLAAELGAASADHLVRTSDADIEALAASDTVAVALPATPFGLNEAEYTPAKKIIAANGLLALATDANPGTAWGESMQFILALACRKMGLTPAQAIAAATINSAAALQRADKIGSLEPNKQADLLILSVSDYRHLGYRFGTNLVSYVVKQGRFYPIA